MLIFVSYFPNFLCKVFICLVHDEFLIIFYIRIEWFCVTHLLVSAYICGRSKCCVDPLSAPRNSVCYLSICELPVNWMCLSDDLAVENEDASVSPRKKRGLCIYFVLRTFFWVLLLRELLRDCLNWAPFYYVWYPNLGDQGVFLSLWFILSSTHFS